VEEKQVKIRKQPKDQERREFIKKSTLVGAGVAASSMAATSAVAAVGDEPESKPTQKGYRLTPHVLSYYKSAGI
jgi:hypothetical protein